MRPIHTTKRLYSIAPLKSTRTPTSAPRPRRTSLSLASAVSSPPSSPPGTSNVSVSGSSGSRSYYTSAAGSLHSAQPPPPLTSSRPGGSNPLNSPRVSLGEHLGEAGSSQNASTNSTSPTINPGSGPGYGTNSAQSSHSPNASQSQLTPNPPNSQSSHHGQTSNGSGQQGGPLQQPGPMTLLTVDGPPSQPSSSPPDHGFFLPGPRTGLASNSAWRPREGTLDNTERATKDAPDSAPRSTSPQKIYQLEVGAYGIPKRGRESVTRPIMRNTPKNSSTTCPKCIEEQAAPEENEDWAYSMDHLEYAVQVGEDAYFVRDDALGVADGVGGWASRHRPRASAMHECDICSAASSSRDHKHQHQLHSHSHAHPHRPRPRRPVQPSPSALFARRLMHFCSHEVGEAQARARQSISTSSSGSPGPGPVPAAMNFTTPGSRSTAPSPSPAQRTPVSMGPSLKNGGISPSPSQRVRGLQKTVIREPGEPNREVRHFGNARPFAWPWDDNYTTHHDHADLNEGTAFGPGSPGLGILFEEEGVDRNRNTTAASATREKEAHATPTSTSSQKGFDTSSAELNDNPDVVTIDPLEGMIDPVEVLERAYEKTIEAHQVRRRVRVVKENEHKSTSSSPSARWWPYGSALGLSSSPYPSLPQSPSQHERQRQRQRQRQTQLESVDVDYEWLDTYEPLTAGSSTALLAVLSGDRLRVAHLGDCVGWLVRAGQIVWRSEEMWWGFNYPVQLGPSSPSQPSDARRYELAVQADDILILASDGVSDNCWEEDVLDEVRRAVEVHLPLSRPQHPMGNGNANDGGMATEKTRTTDLLGRRTLAGMLSEALCSRARQLSMQGRSRARTGAGAPRPAATSATTADPNTSVNSNGLDANANAKGTKLERTTEVTEEELPFERRAREEGRPFRGGKSDDISVLVAIISPVSPSPFSQVPITAAQAQENEIDASA